MAYSTNPVTITNRQAILAPFLRGDPEIVVVLNSARDIRKRMYQIYECCAIGRLYPEYAAVAAIRLNYTFEVRHRTLIARKVNHTTFVHTPQPSVVLPVAHNAAEIIQLWINHDGAATVEILDCSLNPDEQGVVELWAENLNLNLIWHGKKLTIQSEEVSS